MLGIAIDQIDKSNKSMGLFRLSGCPIIAYSWGQKSLFENPGFPIMNMINAYNHSGPLITTCLNTTKQCKLFKRASPVFYVWDLEWLKTSYSAKYLYDLYCDPQIPLIARSQSHFEILTKLWKKPIGIVKEFSYDDIIKLF